MKHILSEHGKLYGILETIMELAIMNILFVICALPIVTIGPSYAGLLTCSIAMERGEGSSVVQTFLKGFTRAFLPSAVFGCCGTVIMGLLFYNFGFTLSVFEGGIRILLLGLYFLLMILMTAYIYHFTYMVAYGKGYQSAYIKKAFLTTLMAFPRSIGIAVLTLSPLVMLFLPIGVGLPLLPLVFLFWFSSAAVLCTKITAKYFAASCKIYQENGKTFS